MTPRGPPVKIDLESLVSGRKNQKKKVEGPKLSREEDAELEIICK
jgi:hypothetical protein